MLESENDSKKQQRQYLMECLKIKKLFVEQIIHELKDGERESSVDYVKFNKVFTPAFCRPSNLRQLMHIKAKNAVFLN